MKITTSTLVTLCGTIVLILLMVAGLIALDKDIDPFVQLMGLIIAAVFPSALNLIKTDRLSDSVKSVERNTNGRMSHLVSIIEATGTSLPADYDDVPRIEVAAQNITPKRGDVDKHMTADTDGSPVVWDYPGGE